MTYQATSTLSVRETVRVELDAGAMIHLWLKSRRPNMAADLKVRIDGVDLKQVIATQTEEFQFNEVLLPHAGNVELSYSPLDAAVSVIYAFHPGRVQKEGIHILHHAAENAPPALLDGYHFRPPFGWMNDPNGFGRFGGKAHLFYQHYPHSLRWNTMHWGHAVSDDYIRWKHLPIFLFPSDQLSQRNDGRGGAFSGSAIPGNGPDGSIRVFFTEQVRDRKPEEQIQLCALSGDGLVAQAPSIVLRERPQGLDLTLDFRDPYVFKGPDGYWKMLLGSRDKSGGVVLLYETLDPRGAEGWTFVGTLHREDRYGMTAAECPCIVPLGDIEPPETRWALIFGLLTSRDPATGRRNLTKVTIGRFDGRTFKPETEQELDFGSDAYAFQAFVDDGGPVGVAWLANWTDVSKKEDFPTAMTLPRRVLWDGSALLTPPIESVDSLRHLALDASRLTSGEQLALETGAIEIEIDLVAPGAPFELRFGHPDIDLGVRLNEDGLEVLFSDRSGNASPRYIAAGARPSQVRIFLDAGSIEVFADKGRWAGTKRLPSFAGISSVQLLAEERTISAARIWQLKI
ncbi:MULTISPECIES: glycoside hydrolase family 32 protein [unclassified Rhizobium]|uniref:glycoside hydrolase family 32 protein n=1 Tax=unclassified Rhizobium TaxID=2613769 RepID=UPI00104799F4|nr:MULTISPECIES: glycoside hydrolase family 32 protein [unclassified Rhizobium]MBB3398582.1 beta-fructofuranosidase [Rhizobium sp. BK060]TCM77066.1 beta-fructofuranosidase [Rhizobium sp. BK068]